mgnify:FL=1
MTRIIQTSLTILLVLISLLANLNQVSALNPQPDGNNPEETHLIYLPVVSRNSSHPGDWIQLGYNAQRTNASPIQVDPPYCYTWKWYEAPIASRAQPEVANGILYIGSMNGIIYARNANTGAPIWEYQTDGPIRHSGAIAGNTVIFSSYDGYTYGFRFNDGALRWQIYTGSSATAPLVPPRLNYVYIASTSGDLSALDPHTGDIVWQFHAGAPILTSPALSEDAQTIYLGTEAIEAIAIRASNGSELWRTSLQGLSLADRYPVVSGTRVMFRSQPNYYFHSLLSDDGDKVLDGTYNGGTFQPLNPDWGVDWAGVRTRILSYLNQEPSKQTFFVLDGNTGQSLGTVPVLYTFGSNDIPNTPVVSSRGIFVTYRARHGIQNDSGTTHVTTRYDAELGSLNLTNLDITGLHSSRWLSGSPEFRMTSDEPSILSMGGNILYVDNWERLGGINTANGNLIHVGAVAKDWPECHEECSPGTNNPFFSSYPFPQPRVTEGRMRGGVVIANNMLYWRVIEAGLAGISHQSGDSCPAPYIWFGKGDNSDEPPLPETPQETVPQRSLSEYITLDLTEPNSNPPSEQVQQIQDLVDSIIQSGDHMTPMFLHRGFTESQLWPYNTDGKSGLPEITQYHTGNAYWFDPGELLYTLAMAYPYLTAEEQQAAREYLAAEWVRYPPLQNLPWSGMTWLKQGVQRELYNVPYRDSLNNWPPPGRNLGTLYGLWLWSKNSGDWSYAQTHWNEITSLFNERKNTQYYYADIAGAIGYARMAAHFGYTNDYNNGVSAALSGMQNGLNFGTFTARSVSNYPDLRPSPPNRATGLTAPVFYGLVPEIGLYLREQLNGQAETYLLERESGNNYPWWYLTRAGINGEIYETSFIDPTAAWSHFLAHAYIIGDSQEQLIKWLDRPWAKGDLFAIQKLVAAVQADH